MEKIAGKSIYKGIAIGRIMLYSKEELRVKRTIIEDCDAQWKRFEDAKKIAIDQLIKLQEKAIKEVGEAEAAIFEVHAMMVEDEDYNDSIRNIIETQKVNVEYAVAVTGDNFSKMFADMEDEYFKARSVDVKDISERIIAALLGKESTTEIGEAPVIVVAKDLTPSETVQFDKNKLLAFVTELGSANSHTAILARTMNIPALIGLNIQESWNGIMAIVDGYSGTLILNPDPQTLGEMEARQRQDLEKRRLLQQLKGKPTQTTDGQKINLYANIGSLADVASVLSNDAEGIGLFRSEFLYLEKDRYPTEEEQFSVYRTVAENMAGKKVIIRTMDIGADKTVDYFGLEHEENPALGYRAIRICLDRRDIFEIQLRAILRASAYGNISVMFPMIISVQEIMDIKGIVEKVKKELKELGITYKEIELGIMIETPAAVMISRELAEEVDFFSIGTNDLSQYTLAIDRQNSKLDNIFDSHHPAILKMIKMTIENGHAGGAWVGICGELGADITLTDTFLQMGIDELSVAPSMVLPIREKVCLT